MKLKSLAYTSLARLDFGAADLMDIHQTARRLNALDGVTGLLVFNGSRFLQLIEGTADAIDHLVERLRADPRHSAFEIRDERMVEARAFPDWSMELVTVSASYMEAHEEIGKVLPPGVPARVRALILAMAEQIAPPMEMPD